MNSGGDSGSRRQLRRPKFCRDATSAPLRSRFRTGGLSIRLKKYGSGGRETPKKMHACKLNHYTHR